MARIHGRRGRVYMGIASGGTAEPVPFLAKWTLNQSTDKAEVTAFGDTTKVYVAGLPDAQGTFSGFFDNATAQTYTAAADGLARNFYLYPDTTNNLQYWFGTILPDFSLDSGVDQAVQLSASWNAASSIAKVG